jgi:hypothetical protein
VPHIEGRGVTFECKTVYKTNMDKAQLNTDFAEKYYSGADNDNLHTLYFAEITAAYEQM